MVVKFRPIRKKIVCIIQANTLENWLSNSDQGRAEADTSHSLSPGSTPVRFVRMCTKWHCERVLWQFFGVPSSLSHHQRPVINHAFIHSSIYIRYCTILVNVIAAKHTLELCPPHPHPPTITY
jgi:hypothetical protein